MILQFLKNNFQNFLNLFLLSLTLDPNYSLLTVKDIASFQGKSIKAVKTFLTKNNMSCKDYPPSKKEKNSSSDDIQIEKQGDLFRDD